MTKLLSHTGYKARVSFDRGCLAKLRPSKRKDTLIRLRKAIRDCELVDLPEATNCITWRADAVDRICDRTGGAMGQRY